MPDWFRWLISVFLQNSAGLNSLDDSIRAGIGYYETVQDEDGLWPGDYGGPMFLMPGLIIALYVSKSLDRVLSGEHKKEMIRYLNNHQNKDGGFGLHIEGHSTMFGTVLRYATPVLCNSGNFLWHAAAERKFKMDLALLDCFPLYTLSSCCCSLPKVISLHRQW